MNSNLSIKENQAIEEFRDKLTESFSLEIKSITLFGSKARGEKKDYSDIDLLVVVEKETLSLWDRIQSISSETSLKYNLLLSVKVIDQSHMQFLKKVQSSFIKNIAREGSSIWKAA